MLGGAATDGARWLLVARTDDRPGVLAALAGVFSTRGVNVDSVVAVRGAGPGPPGTVLAVFRATQRRAVLLQRTVGRLDAVESADLQAHDGSALAVALAGVREAVAATGPPAGRGA